jgi:hypothetical protein
VILSLALILLTTAAVNHAEVQRAEKPRAFLRVTRHSGHLLHDMFHSPSRILTIVLFATACSRGATYYVSTTGNDANAGNVGHPFKTLNKAVTVLTPGDTLLISGGTYSESLVNAIPAGKDWSAPVVIRALDPNNRPILQPSSGTQVIDIETDQYGGPTAHHIVLDGLVVDGTHVGYEGIKISQQAYSIQVLNSEIKNAHGSGIVVDHTSPGWNLFSGLDIHDNGSTQLDHGIYIAASENTIQNSRVHDNAGWGIHVYTGTGTISNDIVQQNQCYNNGRAGGYGAGIGLYSGSGHVAANNSVWGNRDGIAIDFGAAQALVQNNTIEANSEYGIVIGAAATQTQVDSNTIRGNAVNLQNYSTGAIITSNKLQ